MTPGRWIFARTRRAVAHAVSGASFERTHDAPTAGPAGTSAGRVAATLGSAARGAPRRRFDPRLYQIACLAGLVLFGVTQLDFEVTPQRIAVAVGACLATQWLGMRLTRQPGFDPRSPLISGLGLAMLLRTNSDLAMALGAAITIGAKFVFRVNGKHIWNPTNLGIVVMMLFGIGWVSPGQWGSVAFFAFLLACCGGLVVNRAARSDVTYAFLGSYIGLLFGRALWMGEPLAIPLHALQNGAFLIFTFFMISDPRTTPDSRAGRLLFAFTVAAFALWIQYGLHRTNGLLWSLAALAMTVPLIDRVLPGPRHRWNATAAEPKAHVRHPRAAEARPAHAFRGAFQPGGPFPDSFDPLLATVNPPRPVRDSQKRRTP